MTCYMSDSGMSDSLKETGYFLLKLLNILIVIISIINR